MVSTCLQCRTKIHSVSVWKCRMKRFGVFFLYLFYESPFASSPTIHADKTDMKRKAQLLCLAARDSQELLCHLVDCTTLLRRLLRGEEKKNLCTIFWLTRCHLLVRHGNNAQGSDSLTARSLRRNAGEAADARVFNGNRVRDFFFWKRSVTFLVLRLCDTWRPLSGAFFPPLHVVAKLSTHRGQWTSF